MTGGPPNTWREFWRWLLREATPAERRNAAVLAATLAACALVVLGSAAMLVLVAAGVIR